MNVQVEPISKYYIEISLIHKGENTKTLNARSSPQIYNPYMLSQPDLWSMMTLTLSLKYVSLIVTQSLMQWVTLVENAQNNGKLQ